MSATPFNTFGLGVEAGARRLSYHPPTPFPPPTAPLTSFSNIEPAVSIEKVTSVLRKLLSRKEPL